MFDFDRAPMGVRRPRNGRGSMGEARVQVRDIDGVALVVLSGEIGLSNKADVLAAIRVSVESFNFVILSLECDHFSKTNVSLLLALRETIGPGLAIACSEPIRELLNASKVDQIVPVTNSVPDAFELLRRFTSESNTTSLLGFSRRVTAQRVN